MAAVLGAGSLALVGTLSAQDVVAKVAQPPWIAPDWAARKANPLPADEKSLAAGKALFMSTCVPCHGPQGNGDGAAAPFLEKKPGVLSDSKMWLQSDGAIFWKIGEGSTPMPSFKEAITEEQRWQIVNFVRTLAKKPAGGVPVFATAASPTASSAPSTAPAGTDDKYVSRAEYDKLKQELESIKALVQRSGVEAARPVDAIDKDLGEVKKMAKDAFPGSTKMTIVGFGTAGYSSRRGENGSFNGAFNPLMLWKVNDRLLFEGEMELELDGAETSTALEVAQMSYLLNDYITLGAGKFLNPMNFFVERQHMNWVNKLPDRPLAVYDGLLPETILGMQAHGAAPVGSTKVEYSFFFGNAPQLNTTDPAAFGTFSYDNFDNTHDHVVLGGHGGWLPIPELEIGYGFMTGTVGPSDMRANMLMQSADINYVRDSQKLGGLIALRGQWVWSHVDKLTYDPTGALGFGPVTFSNNRNGGYAQASYRPTHSSLKWLQNVEPVLRYDMLNQKNTPVGFDEDRWTLGLNYWLTSTSVVKGAYQFDHKNGTGESADAFMFQFVTGF